MMQDVREIKSRIAIGRKSIQQEGGFCTRKLDLNLRNQLSKCYIWSVTLYGAETGHFGKQIRNAWHVLKCGAGEAWRSVGQIV
jgi:hypothetical protein